MAKILTFQEENHVYEIDGEELPSVTEVCRFISRELYQEISQVVLDRAANRGITVHKLTETLDKYNSCECEDDLLPYIEAYVQFRKKHPAEWTHIEKAMYHPELMYAGCLDRIGTVDGEPAIVDIKTTSQIHTVAVTAQLTLYKRMAEANGIPVSKLYVLQLKKDGKFTLRLVEPDEELADACLTLHRRLEKKKRNYKQNLSKTEE